MTEIPVETRKGMFCYACGKYAIKRRALADSTGHFACDECGYPWKPLLFRLIKQHPDGQIPEPEFLEALAQGMDDLDRERIVDLPSVRRRVAIYEARQALEQAGTFPATPHARPGSSSPHSRRRGRRPSRGSSSR